MCEKEANKIVCLMHVIKMYLHRIAMALFLKMINIWWFDTWKWPSGIAVGACLRLNLPCLLLWIHHYNSWHKCITNASLSREVWDWDLYSQNAYTCGVCKTIIFNHDFFFLLWSMLPLSQSVSVSPTLKNPSARRTYEIFGLTSHCESCHA